MQTSFQNKVVLITGATSGIGKTSALAFAKAGAKVVVSGRRETEGQAVVAEIKASGGEASFVKADVAVEADVAALVAKTVATYGRIDVAFNNAGIESTGHIPDVTEADYRRVFDINVWGVLSSMKHEIPVMLKQGGGVIINTSSVAGHIGMGGVGVYVASKHAVEGLTKSAAMEYAKQGIRVNAVAPAAIETEMFDRFTGGNEDALNYMRNLHPVGRVGRSEEIANPVLFLASDAASFITGISLNVDGGFLAQ
ncbi:SDR family oxidoreductase [Prosthecobacter vanneervenii]|uniref:NAD(P)-dependent dehydrogenase (Short-subunit alcohol dehydrogenase family) n=1 Tax=Prosthecobacter vanneervenii TaxID=48466 RepID=A0A7W8DMA6_9BACT|nr:SDR family oxidoreductase [Prosthecobacter vanneervenii]MBB5034865.1 NAD(P)-dependent dehydrogenase (short-subunit alcohol dehydrogenase family) [Prosthecobacter vanneervenii]